MCLDYWSVVLDALFTFDGLAHVITDEDQGKWLEWLPYVREDFDDVDRDYYLDTIGG